MIDGEKVIKSLKWFRDRDSWREGIMIHDDHAAVRKQICDNAIDLLKEQEGYVSVPFSWLVKFCTHIDFVEPLTDAEREVAWRQKLRQQFEINISKKVV